MYRADTIIARATPPGRGAVAIVRLSGPDARAILGRLFRPTVKQDPCPWRFVHGTVHDPDSPNRTIDEALVVWMRGPRSYTGEDVVEFHCHGSPLVVERLTSAALRLGARPAQAGEFTRRAVLNGRMDLLQAEAVADLIDAKVENGAMMAWEQLQGALSQRLATFRSRVVAILADVEANVDFSDEELPEENIDVRSEALGDVVAEIDELLAGFHASQRLREGYSVVVAGRPNVGKSSLVNALLGHGRMIVSPEPGTTRDSVDELLDVGGMAFVLTDTAGLRAAPCVAETMAVDRAREKIDRADVLVVVLDRSRPLEEDDRALLASVSARVSIIVLNKTDLPSGLTAGDHGLLEGLTVPRLDVSALTGRGCPRLAEQLVVIVSDEITKGTAEVGISRPRHRTALWNARERIGAAIDLMAEGDLQTAELVAFELRAALAELAAVTEPLDNEELLDKIFSEFCIGK